jgi:hypothetical protein
MVDGVHHPSSSLDSNLSTISVCSFIPKSAVKFTNDSSLCWDQSESMVEIKRTESTSASIDSNSREEEDKYRLLYSKSKVYVHPTAYARDNIPGFVALVKRVRCSTAEFQFFHSW